MRTLRDLADVDGKRVLVVLVSHPGRPQDGASLELIEGKTLPGVEALG